MGASFEDLDARNPTVKIVPNLDARFTSKKAQISQPTPPTRGKKSLQNSQFVTSGTCDALFITTRDIGAS